jgi:hypothetical protein
LADFYFLDRARPVDRQHKGSGHEARLKILKAIDDFLLGLPGARRSVSL